MRTLLILLAIPLALVAGESAIILPVPSGAQARILQYVFSLAFQVVVAGIAFVLARRAAQAHEPHDPERGVWRQISLVALGWTIGLAVHGAAAWVGRPLAAPSAIDLFFLLALVIMIMALVGPFRLANRLLTRGQRLGLVVATVLAWGAIAAGVVWPILTSPVNLIGRGLGVFYAIVAASFLTMGLPTTVASSEPGRAFTWLAITLGACCLALAAAGVSYLMWLGLYSDVHPIGLLRVAGLALLATGAWHSRSLRVHGPTMAAMEPRVARVLERPAPVKIGRTWKRPRVGWQSLAVWRPTRAADTPFLISIGLGILGGSLIVLLVIAPWRGPHKAPASAQSPLVAPQRVSPSGTPATPQDAAATEAALRRAQDEHLQELIKSPDDPQAMRALIAIRRRLAHDDPALLRRQAAVYQEGIARGVESEEHYTLEAMRVLVKANLAAADEIEAERAKKP